MYKYPALEQFIATIPVESMADKLGTLNNIPHQHALQILATYINEMRVAMQLIEPLLDHDQRILEVGAGLCLFSLYLKQAGYNVIALEPAIGGFDIFTRIKQLVLKTYQAIPLSVIDLPAHMLNPTLHGKFDLIFSNNVMEHIPDYGTALQAMSGCLADNGLMVHGCPNYFIPYEPHVQIPVLKFWPQLSEYLFNKSIRVHTELWQSLNFIDYFDVIKVGRHLDLQVNFRPKLMYQAIKRLGEDVEFRHRHFSIVITILYYVTRIPGILWLLKHLPPWLATPMIFECRHN